MIERLKPYPVYKDSGVEWLGKAPEHWEVQPALAAFRQDLTTNKGMIEKTVLSLSYGRIIVKPVEKLHGLVPESFETYQIVNSGNIIVRTTDLQNDHTSLRVGYCDNRGIITSAYLCLTAYGRMSTTYGYQLLNTYDLLKIFYGFGSGLRQNLGFGDIRRMPVLIPPVLEQNHIVDYLRHVDVQIRRYIVAKQKLIKLLEEQKQAIIHRAVTRGLDPNVRLKPSGVEWLGDVPEHWVPVRLKHVARIQTGLTLGKIYGAGPLEERPYLRVANVQTGHVSLDLVKTVAVPHAECLATELRAGDVLMTEGGDIDKLGRGCVWNGEVVGCLHQNHIFAVRPDPSRLLPQFLSVLMSSGHGRMYFQLTAKQTTNLASTNSTTLGAFPLFLPEVSEQGRILQMIAVDTQNVRNAADKAASEISLLREFRTRLISDVVTGKLDVRKAAAHLPDGSAPLLEESVEEIVENDLDELETAVEEEVEA